MRSRILLVVGVTSAAAACTFSGLDGLSGGATYDAGSDAGADASPDVASDAPSTDVGGDSASDAPVDALSGGCQGAVACERVIFVTKDTFGVSDFGGLAGADDVCNRVANAPDASARVRGRPFRAWLSTSTTSAAGRLVHGTKHYVRPDLSVLAVDWSHLVGGALSYNVDVDETGKDLPAPDWAWTGTMTAGDSDDKLCSDWTSSSTAVLGLAGFTAVSSTDASPETWTFGQDTPCDHHLHLYCVEL